MHIVVIGGTGLIGSKLVARMRRAGHEALAASPESGVDAYTGTGLDQALEGAQVVVDVSNAPDWDAAAVLDFFRTTSRNLLAAETAAGVRHHVALSVVGTDRLGCLLGLTQPPFSGPHRGHTEAILSAAQEAGQTLSEYVLRRLGLRGPTA